MEGSRVNHNFVINIINQDWPKKVEDYSRKPYINDMRTFHKNGDFSMVENQDDMLKLNLVYLKMDFDRLCNAHWDLFKIKNLLTDWREYL